MPPCSCSLSLADVLREQMLCFFSGSAAMVQTKSITHTKQRMACDKGKKLPMQVYSKQKVFISP